ncbi:GyrI-like domain-containing protein [Flavobacterium sp. '19STA2R22 D10 B1']|uniref:GyrI-like domain-containing protein n=1 Tax=Flavobacterium aerium TaxID=3037261 RepID=UPI00278C38F2|nr:GyrI-like domain-containing protein [Flavobacterium sp. '19STA2R22 D10 B1']
MNTPTTLESFKIIGITVRTTNKNGKAMEDIGNLWNRFYTSNIQTLIPNKEDSAIYSIYTDYESDYTGKYTCILGCKVSSLNDIPEGLEGKEINGGKYIKYTAKGKMPEAVGQTWGEIWNQDTQLNRLYTADFEVYDEKSALPQDQAEVGIYIAI